MVTQYIAMVTMWHYGDGKRGRRHCCTELGLHPLSKSCYHHSIATLGEGREGGMGGGREGEGWGEGEREGWGGREIKNSRSDKS